MPRMKGAPSQFSKSIRQEMPTFTHCRQRLEPAVESDATRELTSLSLAALIYDWSCATRACRRGKFLGHVGEEAVFWFGAAWRLGLLHAIWSDAAPEKLPTISRRRRPVAYAMPCRQIGRAHVWTPVNKAHLV